MKKYLIQFIFVVLIFILHQSFLINLTPKLNLWPTILVFLIFFFTPKTFLSWIFSFAFLIDIYSPFFGINLTIFFIITLIIYFLKKNLLTNRSLMAYSILILTGVILSNLFFYLSSKIFNLQHLILIDLNTIFIQILVNFILSILLFFFIFRFTNLLHPNLFEKK